MFFGKPYGIFSGKVFGIIRGIFSGKIQEIISGKIREINPEINPGKTKGKGCLAVVIGFPLPAAAGADERRRDDAQAGMWGATRRRTGGDGRGKEVKAGPRVAAWVTRQTRPGRSSRRPT